MYNGRKKEKGSVNQHTVAKVQNEPLQTTAEVIAKGNYGTACTKCGRKQTEAERIVIFRVLILSPPKQLKSSQRKLRMRRPVELIEIVGRRWHNVICGIGFD